MKKQEPILPGLEVAIAEMESDALSDTAIESLPVYTAERVAVHDTDRYNLAARLLFAENISRRTICRWLHMSPNTLSAIEVRELRLHPELINKLRTEAAAEITQLKRLGLEAMRARFFDQKAMSKTSLKDIVSTLKTLAELSGDIQPDVPESNRNTQDNDYLDVLDVDEPNGLSREKISAPEMVDCNYDAALNEQRIEPQNSGSNGESGIESEVANSVANRSSFHKTELKTPLK